MVFASELSIDPIYCTPAQNMQMQARPPLALRVSIDASPVPGLHNREMYT